MAHSLDGVVVTDIAADRYVDASRSFLTMFGLDAVQLRAHPASELLRVDPEETREQARRALLEGVHSWQGTASLTSLAGVTRVVDMTASYDEDEGVAVTVLRDVTERAEMAAMWEALMGHANDVILIVDENGRYLSASASAEHVLGYPLDVMMGRTPAEFGLVEAGALEERMRAARVEGGYRRTIRARAGDGRDLVIEAVASRVSDKFVVVARDVTEREEMAAMWEALLEFSHDAVAVMDARSERYLAVSRSFERLVGRAAADLLGRTAIEAGIMHPGRHPRILERSEAFPSVEDYAIQTADGGTRIVSASMSLVGDRLLAVMRDVTERRQLEREKDDFIAYASHELRTPLSVVAGSAQTIRDRPDLAPEVRESLDRLILENAVRLERLTQQLLDLDRVETGTVVVRPQRVRLLEVAEALAAQAPGPVEVVVDAGLEVELDVDLLERVLGNLLANAFKYGAEPVRLEARRNGSLVVTVSDRGRGVPLEFQGRMFERFTRSADSADDRPSGAGLGLSIARSYAALLGGRLRYRGNVPTGACFDVVLPPSVIA
jgi:PAS domain S-box-containing protein